MAELEKENLGILDLDDEEDIDQLPAGDFCAAPRPRRPWLLLGIAALVIALAVYIIIAIVGRDSNSIDINLDAPIVEVSAPNDGAAPAPKVEGPAPAAPASVVIQHDGMPIRIVEERKEIKFNPSAKPAASAPVVKKPVALAKPAIAKSAGGWYVQLGSYASKSAAEAGQKKIRAAHSSLFADKQFVILAAVLPNGSTTYRLRIAFASPDEASGFCRNAKSDGLECYVAR